MLGFVISTIAFSLAARALNRYFEAQSADGAHSRRWLVLSVATLISIGSGWVVDKMDGDADAPRRNISMIDAVRSGDPILIAKMLAGIN